MKKFTAIASSVLLLAAHFSLTPNSASAHGSLVSSSPKASSVLAKMPKIVWVGFDGNLITIAGKQTNFLSVKNSKGRELSDGKAYVTGSRVNVKITDQSAVGKIKVSWRVVSQDGHPVSSSLTFTVEK